jgi:MFS family permease
MCEELGWSRSAMSAPYTAFWIFTGLLGPLAGITIGKFGARKNIIIGNLVIALGVLGMSLVKEVWHIYLFYTVLIGGGQAFGTFIAITTTINSWFTRRRSLILSLVLSSGGIGALTFAPLISWLIASQGWRTAWICVAGLHLILAVVAGGILIRNKPEKPYQTPESETTSASQVAEADSPLKSRTYQTPVEWRVGDALRTPALWLVVAFVSSSMFTLNFLSLHQVAYLQDLQFSPMVAATTVGMLSGMSIVGQLASGALGSRFEGRHIAAVCLVGFAVGITILMNVRSLPLIYLHTVISGISCGGIMVIMPVLIGAYFGSAAYAQIIGWTTPVTTLFSAGSPLLAALIFDNTGSYTSVFTIALILLGVGLVCALLARPPKPGRTMPDLLPADAPDNGKNIL